MSNLIEKLNSAHKRPRTVKQWISAHLTDEEIQELNDTILSEEVSVSQIHRILKSLDDPFPYGLTSFKEYAREIRRES